jgi:hypothetical protein
VIVNKVCSVVPFECEWAAATAVRSKPAIYSL